eukprot:Sdes_comp19595_c0_seq1m11320
MNPRFKMQMRENPEKGNQFSSDEIFHENQDCGAEPFDSNRSNLSKCGEDFDKILKESLIYGPLLSKVKQGYENFIEFHERMELELEVLSSKLLKLMSRKNPEQQMSKYKVKVEKYKAELLQIEEKNQQLISKLAAHKPKKTKQMSEIGSSSTKESTSEEQTAEPSTNTKATKEYSENEKNKDKVKKIFIPEKYLKRTENATSYDSEI